jgi:tetratricopeptide (TPR) repeat protein
VAVALLCLAAAALGARTVTRNRDYASELRLSETTLAHWPSAVAHDMVGLSLARLDRREEAIVELQQAIADYPPARYDLGVQYYSLNRFDQAIEQLRQFVTLEPDLYTTSAAYTLLGGSLDRKGRPAEAIEAYQHAVGGSIPDLQAHGFLADLLADAQRYDEAITHYRAYLKAFPGRTAAMVNLGIALASAHRPDEALAVFRQAVQADPSNGQAHLNLGQMLLELGQVDAALVEARQVVTLAPRNPVGYDLLGQALATKKDWAGARQAFERALEIAPNYAPARENLRRLPR